MSNLSRNAQPVAVSTNEALHNSNIFDIIRHIAALAVLFSHHYAFSGLSEPKVFGITKLGTFSVVVFFSISGYLITQSYLRTSSPYSYFKKRISRIFPALIVCSLIMTMLVCTIFGKADWQSYLASKEAITNFIYYSFFGAHAAPEQINYFSSNYIYKDALNGSLWTLFFEFFDYMLIALFIFNKSRPITSISALLIGSIIIQVATKLGLPTNYYIDRATILTIPFAIGGILFLTKEYWYRKKIGIVLIIFAIIAAFFSQENDERSILFFSSTAILTVIIGNAFKDTLISGRFDFSYGIYIYAYPTQQIIINETGLGFWASLSLSAIITILLANFSWFFIEKKFIQKKRTPPTTIITHHQPS